jgi:hypothetical protein
MRNTAVQLQRLARERADEQARRIPWQRLLDTRAQYIDWQEFYLRVRSILEVEDQIPGWLVHILKERCPGFLERDKTLTTKAVKEKPFALRLEDWIDEHAFGFAQNEGWFNAITYYAVRDSRYQRAEVCWSECVERWRRAKPIPYPSFEEWKDMASQCNDTTHLVPHERRARATSKLVDRDRLGAAASQYMDWEAFAYWTRPALERPSQLPVEVRSELRSRCSGFLDLIDSQSGQEGKASSQLAPAHVLDR